MSEEKHPIVSLLGRKLVFGGRGVRSFFSMRWLLVMGLYLFAFACMARDPWFGRDTFTYAQGGYVMLLSFVLTCTICFDWCYLGRSRGGNLFLQFLLMLPMTLLLGRLIGSPSERLVEQGGTLLRQVGLAFKSVAGFVGVVELIPGPIKELFASPRAVILFAGICLALTAARGKILRVGLLVTVFAFLFAFALADAATAPTWMFHVGVGLMIAGMALQFHDVANEAIDRNIAERLRNVMDEAERRCSIRVLKKVCAEGRITPRAAYEIIHRCYVERFGASPEKVRAEVAPLILNRLVHEHGLLSVALVRGVAEIRPTAALTRSRNPLLAVALVPRCVVVGVIAFIWWVTPIDLIPDAIPLLGSLDDFVIVSLGGGGVLQTLKSLRKRKDGDLIEVESVE